MGSLRRMSITIDEELAEMFERLLKRKGYSNRSEAVRDLVRRALVEQQWEEGQKTTVGTLTIVYDHGRPELARRLLEAGHEAHNMVMATMHVHLDETYCLEVMALKGKASKVRKYADQALGAKGVKHGDLVMTTMGL